MNAAGVKVPSGEYTVLPPQNGGFHLDCTLAEGGPKRPFGLDLSGVDLIITVSGCSTSIWNPRQHAFKDMREMQHSVGQP